MKFIGFDIETAGEGDGFGLQPYRVLQGSARITSAAFVSESGDIFWSSLNPNIESLRTQFQKAAASEATLIGWNTQFDIAWLIAAGLEEEVRKCTWLDGEVLRRAIENDTTDKSYGLKPTVAKYLPDFAGYESEVAGNFDVVNQTLLDYNTLDAGLTAKLGRIFWDQLDDRRRTLATVICQGIIPVAGAWVEGIAIDEKAVNHWNNEAGKEIHAALLETMKYVQCTSQDEIDGWMAALNSPTKLKTILNTLGHPVEKTDRDELSKFKDVPLIRAISDYKQANTSRTKFIAGIRQSLKYNGTDRTHPSCRLWNTYTGRFGYTSKTLKKFQTGIAIHQFPRKTEARNCIVAPEGYLLVECDFATQESRLLCDFSGDETLQNIFEKKLDFHSYMGAIIAEQNYDDFVDRIANKDPEAKNYRQLAKVVNLSCAYRTGWKKLIDVARTQFDIVIGDAMARRLHGLFRTTYKRVPEYWETSVYAAKENGFAETRGGRRVFISDWSRANAWSAESTAINFPIQGTGADMKVLGIAMIDDMLYRNGGKYLLDLHDAIFCLVPDTSNGYDVASQIKNTLSSLPYKEIYNWEPRVSLPVDLKVGKRWGSLEEIK